MHLLPPLSHSCCAAWYPLHPRERQSQSARCCTEPASPFPKQQEKAGKEAPESLPSDATSQKGNSSPKPHPAIAIHKLAETICHHGACCPLVVSTLTCKTKSQGYQMGREEDWRELALGSPRKQVHPTPSKPHRRHQHPEIFQDLDLKHVGEAAIPGTPRSPTASRLPFYPQPWGFSQDQSPRL